jgi:uncharacterized membrane protein YeiH
VGELIKLAVERGRATRPDIELGICGEHGGDPVSINLFEQVSPLLLRRVCYVAPCVVACWLCYMCLQLVSANGRMCTGLASLRRSH